MDSDFSVFDQEAYEACIAKSIDRLETAQILGTETVRLDPRSSLSGRDREEVDLDELLTKIALGMQRVSDAAAPKGMKVGVENHGSLIGRSDNVARMLEIVDRPNFGVNLDPTNFRGVFGEDHIAATRRFASRVVHCHIKDFYSSAEEPKEEGWRQNPAGRASVWGYVWVPPDVCTPHTPP